MAVKTHYTKTGAPMTGCGRDARRLAHTDSQDDVTCKACAKIIARTFVGESRGRKQYKIVCKGGPWGGSEAVFAEQESGMGDSGAMSLPIRVGEHVGRYNLNTGTWVPMETKE